MPVVFVHGNPETTAIWDPLRKELGRDDVIALSPPGFGAPVPDGFGGTSDDYVAWLVRELEAIDGPIDLVGHDWGGGHVMRVANEHPERVRSWCTDIAGCFDPEYVWHDMAQVWQSDAGEQVVEGMAATPTEQVVEQFAAMGMGHEVASRVAPAVNEDMARCILSLYRSAAQPAMCEWGKDLSGARSRPGFVIIATGDLFTGGEALARRTAERAGARVGLLQGLGHWWMCEDPAAGARVLGEYLDGVA